MAFLDRNLGQLSENCFFLVWNMILNNQKLGGHHVLWILELFDSTQFNSLKFPLTATQKRWMILQNLKDKNQFKKTKNIWHFEIWNYSKIIQNRGPLKDLNDSKLIVWVQVIPLIIQDQFYIFRGPLFHKPVTGQELFCCFLQQTSSN